MSLSIYTVNEKYISKLRNIDNKVYINKNEKRAYIGIVLNMDGINYFSPLSSPKLKHLDMKNQIDFFKMDNGKLGVINFNNSIPVTLENIKLLDIDYLFNSNNKSDRQYALLCIKQIKWCRKNELKIKEKFKKLYSLLNENKLPKNIKLRCCDFKALEEYIIK